MKRVSNKRRHLISSVAPFREAFRRRVGRCEKCLESASPDNLDLHELVPGYVRSQALDKPYALLALHRLCHWEIEALTIPHQLAYLMRSRPNDFNPEMYWKLIGRRWPDVEHVLYFLERLPIKNTKGRQ